jgi:hypothetical protein
VSPASNRASILEHGLDWALGRPQHLQLLGGPDYGSDDYPQANYLFATEAWAQQYAAQLDWEPDGAAADIWQIDLTRIDEEPWPDPQGVGDAWTLDEPVPAHALRLLCV